MKTPPATFLVPHQYPVTIERTAHDRFTVTYGAEQKRGLSYDEATRELGECLMHALTCNDFDTRAGA